MNLTREQARELLNKKNEEKHLNILRKYGEGVLYARLNARHLDEIPKGIGKVEYVKMLKKKIKKDC